MPSVRIRPRPSPSGPPPWPFALNTESEQADGLQFWAPMSPGFANIAGGAAHDVGYGGTPGVCAGGFNPARLMPMEGTGPLPVPTGAFFDGASNRIDYPPVQPSLTGVPITCSAWVYSTNVAASSYVLALSRAAGVNPSVTFGINASRAALSRTGTAGTTAKTGGSVATLLNYVWYHIAVVDPAISTVGSEMRPFINGVQSAIGLTNTGVADDPTNVFPTSLGGRVPDTLRSWFGTFYDVRLYNRVLSNNEVYALYDTNTRWDLFRPLPSTRVYVFGTVGAAFLPRLTVLGAG